MAKSIVNIIGGGAIAKNVKLQVFLEPKMYLEMIQEAKHYNIVARNDSELIRKLISMLFNQLPMLTIEIEQLKKGLARKQTIIDSMESTKNKEVKKK